ncbi:Trp biosynthesis-associated membrane protein [Nocardioides nanhaiensis]|uniref:Trp biosynthesis protein n=1 Tax=Nocardioides nanhaiensis TaxID=1476871 RepID=A0ABP8WY70_9ACTN
MADSPAPDSPGSPDRSRRRTFGPVVLVGLASAGALAVAGAQPWQSPDTDSVTAQITAAAAGGSALEAPLVTALGLVLLAAWGVVLVTRGRVRRGVAVLGTLAALGAAVAAVVSLVLDPAAPSTGIGGAELPARLTASPTGWAWLGVVAAVVAVAAVVVAVREVPHWPEMGSRYDAPGERASASASASVVGSAEPGDPIEERSNLDLWKAIDEGRDPTR